MKLKIRYEKVTNPSPGIDGYRIYIDGVLQHTGYFVSIDAVREWWVNYLVVNGYWNTRHDLANAIQGDLGKFFFSQLQQFPFPPYYVYTWSRDCDMYESSRVERVDSYIDLVKHFRDYRRGLEWAEGPSSWQLIEQTETGRWTRDRAMEAFENGRGSCLSV